MRRFSLQDLMPRFLDLSAEVANCMGHVNAQWFQLAAEFMLQCALERIEWIASISEPDLHTESHPVLDGYLQWLAECFAWGAAPGVKPTASLAQSILRSCSIPLDEATIFSTQQMLRVEQHIIGIFTSKPPTDAESPTNPNNGTDKVPPPESSQLREEPIWTALRQQYQSQAHEYLTHRLAAKPDENPQLSLQTQHPQHDFLAHLVAFVDGLWCLNMGSINEKPILVQIEEGGIQGLSQDEFTAFLGRVGLKMADRGGSGGIQIRWSVPGEERKRTREEN